MSDDVKQYVKFSSIRKKINNPKTTNWPAEGLTVTEINEALVRAILIELKAARVSDRHIQAAINIAEKALETCKKEEKNGDK